MGKGGAGRNVRRRGPEASRRQPVRLSTSEVLELAGYDTVPEEQLHQSASLIHTVLTLSTFWRVCLPTSCGTVPIDSPLACRQLAGLPTGEELKLAGKQTRQEVERVEDGVSLEQPVGGVLFVIFIALVTSHAYSCSTSRRKG